MENKVIAKEYVDKNCKYAEKENWKQEFEDYKLLNSNENHIPRIN